MTTHLTMFWRSAPEKPGVPRAISMGSTAVEKPQKRFLQQRRYLTRLDDDGTHMMLQDLCATPEVRKRYLNMPIKSTWSNKRTEKV